MGYLGRSGKGQETMTRFAACYVTLCFAGKRNGGRGGSTKPNINGCSLYGCGVGWLSRAAKSS